MRSTIRAVTAASFTALLLLASPARAIVFQVGSTADKPDAVLDGICADVDGVCTIRAAVQEANANPGEDIINVLPGKYTLKLVGAGEDAAATGDLDLTGDVIIQASNPKVAVINGKKDRVFHTFPGTTVTIRGLTIAKGAILTKDPNANSDDFEGGGILNQGTLGLDNVVVTGNKSQDDGGGISNRGTLTLSQVAITKNKALDDAGGLYNPGTTAGVVDASAVTFAKNQAADQGGAIENQAVMTLTNCTVSANKAADDGGAIDNTDGATLTLQNVTFKDNKTKSKTSSGGVADAASGVVTMRNTILDKNKPFNCAGPITLAGGNLETGAGCGLSPAESNIKKMGLAGLKVNAPIYYATHALKAESPAIDFGTDVGCPQLDQNYRGRVDVPNVGVGVCDSGAVEFQLP